ncbi:amidohydrolase family-domain-containing protein [Cyathus striatus]|nr:amidohydrolase family-domain-containing protein [Cyathus striatus]
MSTKSRSHTLPPPPTGTPRTQWIIAALFASLLLLVLSRENNEYTLCASAGIYTVEAARQRVDCIHIKGDIVTDWGSLDEIQSRHKTSNFAQLPINKWISQPLLHILGLEVKQIQVEDDAHAHVLEYGYMMQLPLAEATSVQDVVDRIKAYILAHPDVLIDKDRWVEGMGWDQTKWPGKKFPTAEDLAADPLLRDRPIALRRVDGHATWVSPRVLQIMGNDLPKDVDGGIIVRDNQGKPTGIFIDNAISLIPIPPWSESQMEAFFQTSMEEVLKNGLTNIHDAASSPEMIAFMKKSEEGDLPIRLYMMGNVENEDEYWGNQIPRLINYGKNGRLNVRSIKLFTDGALGSWGAALLKPYFDKPDTSGIMRTEPEKLKHLVKQFWKDGWQVNIHCIGDRANRAVLDIYEEILTKDGANATEWRPRIEHAQIIDLEDLERVGKLGVIPSVQPTHATSDMWYAETRLGPDRINGAYAYQTLLRNSPSHVLPLGSDFPVEGVNPLLGFYASVSRLSVSGDSPHGASGWFPEQKLTREQALKGMTLDPAYASFSEAKVGSLRPGKKADFVVLDRDILKVPVGEVLKTTVKATVVDGKVAYGKL